MDRDKYDPVEDVVPPERHTIATLPIGPPPPGTQTFERSWCDPSTTKLIKKWLRSSLVNCGSRTADLVAPPTTVTTTKHPLPCRHRSEIRFASRPVFERLWGKRFRFLGR